MKKLNAIALLATLLLFNSCKTREDIAREQLVDNMAIQINDSQKLNTDFTVRVQALEERISMITGQVEEGQHKNKITFDERMKSLEEKLKVVEQTNSTNSQNYEKLVKQLEQQDKYLKEVLSTLSGLSKKKIASNKKLSDYDESMLLYKKGNYTEAKAKFSELLSNPKLSNGRKKRILHNYGMSEYIEKNNEQALVYFSRLFTEFPKSDYNKNGLLFLAKTFNRLGKTAEAKQTLEELVKRFPDAKQIKEAKKLLSNL